MSSSKPFEVLGIEKKGATLQSVKKAYSKKLKETRPDEDPEGFMALREAYNLARTQTEWAQFDEEEFEQEETSNVDQATAEPQEEIKYWHDEALNYHFNSSPAGKLTEKTVRWIKQKKAANGKEFLTAIFAEHAQLKKAEAETFRNFLRGYIYYEAGGKDIFEDEDDGKDEENHDDLTEREYQRPMWLSDEIVTTIHRQFDFLSEQPTYEWDARQLNCVKRLFEPVLIEQGLIDKETETFDLLDIRAKEWEKHNKDDHGSYFDKQERKWIDMSPVGLAMRDFEAILEQTWKQKNLHYWEEILQREELQSIDEFQQLDDRLRHMITTKTGMGEQDHPTRPSWLTSQVMELLDDYFGWSHQSGRTIWEHDSYRWIHRLTKTKQTAAPPQQQQFKSWQSLDKSSFEYLGYQPLPWFIHPYFLIGSYLTYRLLLALSRIVS
jgi:curved DNA-binding protein CbpA